jgi:hypothetical protein
MAEPMLPERGILLHIGPHKTGTTALQNALAANRALLRENGVLYPDGPAGHYRPALAALGSPLGWEQQPPARDQWLDLVAQLRVHDHRAVFSNEELCVADARTAETILSELGIDRVHVVITLRPLESLLPSSWQQYVKGGSSVGYAEWLEDVLASRDKRTVTPSFWARHDHAALIRRWLAPVGLDRMLVMVVDPREPRRLFDWFEQLLSLPAGSLDSRQSSRSNRSLSAPEAELLRQLNAQVPARVRSQWHYRAVKPLTVRNLVERRTPGPDEQRLTLPAWAVERAREFSRSDVADIEALGVRVLGDLAELVPGTLLPEQQMMEQTDSVPAALAATFLKSAFEASRQISEKSGGKRREPASQVASTPRPASATSRSVPAARAPRLAARTRRQVSRIPLLGRLRARLGR